MRTVRIKLLITLILVAVASVTLSTVSSALTKLSGSTDPSWTTTIGASEGTVINGEPEAGGGSAPPPSPGKTYSAGQQRGEAPVSAAQKYWVWLTWMSRIWAARLGGLPF